MLCAVAVSGARLQMNAGSVDNKGKRKWRPGGRQGDSFQCTHQVALCIRFTWHSVPEMLPGILPA